MSLPVLALGCQAGSPFLICCLWRSCTQHLTFDLSKFTSGFHVLQYDSNLSRLFCKPCSLVDIIMSRGRNSGSPVARGYQILLWATRNKSSCSPLGYQTLWLYGRENQQLAIHICSTYWYWPAMSVCQMGTPYRLLLWTFHKKICAECLTRIDIVIAD